jgi:hypothetical protein
MVERIFNKIDALNCAITETQEITKNVTVDGIMARKKELEGQLKEIIKVITEMKTSGCDFSKHEPE